MSYQYRTDLEDLNLKVKSAILPPVNFGNDLIEALLVEWFPNSDRVMFCWVYVWDSNQLWVLHNGVWVATDGSVEEFGRSVASVVDKLPAFNYEQAKGCGALVEQIALSQLRLTRNKGQLH